MPRSYVNNAQNRSLGRVGMPVGSMPVSRGSSGASSGSRSAGSYGSSSFGGTKTYVDNSYNRSLGRVGLEHGTAVVSRTGSASWSSGSSSSKTYVDNAQNRRLGRVGMPHGSMPVSRSSSGSTCMSNNPFGVSSSGRVYVDNAQNRSLGRVGMPHGSMPVSRSSSASFPDHSFGVPASASAGRVYVDNAMNRRLGRVGKPLGSMPHSSSASNRSSSQKCYVDNSMNRALGRVGLPLGSMPVSSKSKQTQIAKNIYQQMRKNPDEDIDFGRFRDLMETEYDEEACDVVIDLINRMNQVRLWQNETGTKGQPKTSSPLLQRYEGTTIDFEELELQKKIGQGGFGDVYFAKWKGSVVAVKKLRVQRVSKKRLKEFTDELLIFCELQHPNIVKFIGACVRTPNLAIVMEYMQCSLFEALHVQEDHEFSGEDRMSIIKQILCGLEYLHGRQIAHCDLKSLNVLLDLEGENPVAKLTDFGLSMMKAETESSLSAAECVRNIGTPRYSAPEVLRGELLRRKEMIKTDMYSASLVVFEIIYEEEPFANLKYAQLQKQVGEGSAEPDIPSSVKVSSKLLRKMRSCWSRNPDDRPSASDFLSAVESLSCVWKN